MNNTYAIILAGGTGKRFNKNTPKQFVEINGKPIIAWSLEKFNKLTEINGIIVVSSNEYINSVHEIVNQNRINDIIKIVPGGETRQGSSYNAINSMNFGNDDILIFHDAARPFLNEDVILNCINGAKQHGAAGVYVRAVDTITEVKKGFVHKIPDRRYIYHTQTPQAFTYKIIKEAHELALSNNITDASDDVQLVNNAQLNIKVIEGENQNIKITTPFDIELAELIARGHT